jgi:hypothetical protein
VLVYICIYIPVYIRYRRKIIIIYLRSSASKAVRTWDEISYFMRGIWFYFLLRSVSCSYIYVYARMHTTYVIEGKSSRFISAPQLKRSLGHGMRSLLFDKKYVRTYLQRSVLCSYTYIYACTHTLSKGNHHSSSLPAQLNSYYLLAFRQERYTFPFLKRSYAHIHT